MSTIKKDKVTIRQAVLPIRALFHHLKLFFLLIMAIGILVISKVDSDAARIVRSGIMDMVTPVLSALSHPMTSFFGIKEDIQHLIAVHRENAHLRQENGQLLRMKAVALELEAENMRLRELVKFVPEAATEFVTARMVGDAGTPYSKSAIINAGSAEGVKDGQVVYNKQGLIGRITEAGVHNARVLMMTDINSRVPVMGETSRERSVLAGKNGGMAELLHLSMETALSVGEKIITSGDGGYFPEGIVVGTVTSVSEGSAEVTPAVDWSRLELVTVAGVRNVPEPVVAPVSAEVTPAHVTPAPGK